MKNGKIFFSIQRQRKQVINGEIKIIQEEIATRVTENQTKFANSNQINPDEICEDFKSGDYKARKVIFVNYGYKNSMQEDMCNCTPTFEKPNIYKCHIVFQEINENNSNATYKENVKMKRLPQLQSSSQWQDVPMLKLTLHRKSKKEEKEEKEDMVL